MEMFPLPPTGITRIEDVTFSLPAEWSSTLRQVHRCMGAPMPIVSFLLDGVSSESEGPQQWWEKELCQVLNGSHELVR